MELDDNFLIYCGTKRINDLKPIDDLTNYRFWAMLVFPSDIMYDSNYWHNYWHIPVWGKIGGAVRYKCINSDNWYQNLVNAKHKINDKYPTYNMLYSRYYGHDLFQSQPPLVPTSELLINGDSSRHPDRIEHVPQCLLDEFRKIGMMIVLKN